MGSESKEGPQTGSCALFWAHWMPLCYFRTGFDPTRFGGRQPKAFLASMLIEVRIYSDLACPWCYIGKQQLDRALELIKEEYPDAKVVPEWHA